METRLGKWEKFFGLISPVHTIQDDIFDDAGIEVYIKRDDLLHPYVSGNKWRKLKYNLYYAFTRNIKKIKSMGGAFSNHLVALAKAGTIFDFQTSGLIRAHTIDENNPTIRFLLEHNMDLTPLSRKRFQQVRAQFEKTDRSLPPSIEDQVLFLPEGGSNSMAVKGCAELVDEVIDQIGHIPEYWLIAAGTGGTAAGIIKGLRGRAQVFVIPVLRGDFMDENIRYLLPESEKYAHWKCLKNRHLGGIAKYDEALLNTMRKSYSSWKIVLDPIYTAKLFHTLQDLVRHKQFRHDSRVLCIHTGGLQGIPGFNYMTGLDLPSEIPDIIQ